MRHVLAAPILAVLAAPAAAAPSADIPLTAIGLPFAPEAPHPVGPDHPLYHRVAVTEIADLPGGIRFSTAPPFRINRGLRDTLDQMHMLAPSDAEAKVRLTARWMDIGMEGRGLRGPRQATATLAYTLTRLDDGKTLFDRTVETSVDAEGRALDYGMGMSRAAIAANFASLAACLDKAAYGRAPEDCALTPLFKVLTTIHYR